MSDTDEKKRIYAGGCLCGAVRYEATDLRSAAYCHCRMCQKASGGPFVAVAQFARDSFRFTRGEPRWHRSSDIMERGFCAECGTPLGVRYLTAEWSDWLGIMIAGLDAPGAVPPEIHYGTESRLPWLALADDLPEQAYEENFIEERAEGDRSNPDGRPSGYRWRDGIER